MIYTDAKGQRWNIDRKYARQMDVKEGRYRLIGEQTHAYKQCVAALNAVLFAEQQLQKRLKKHRLWSSIRIAEGHLRRVKMELAKTITTEQICTLQHDTQGIYIQLNHAPQPDMIPVEKSDLSSLVACARGLLHDQDGVTHNCHNCVSAGRRQVWQNCALHDLLLRIDCYKDGEQGSGVEMVQEHFAKNGICPFLLADHIDALSDELEALDDD